MRSIKSVFFLAAFLLCYAVDATAWIHGGAPWMVNTNRWGIGRSINQVTSPNIFFKNQLFAFTGNWDCKNPRLLYSNSYSVAGNITNTGNTVDWSGAALWVNGSFVAQWTIDNGNQTKTFANGEMAWTDALPVTITKNSQYAVRTTGGAAANAFIPNTVFQVNTSIGEGSAVSSSTQVASLTSGTIAAIDGGAATWAPATMVCQGWDGSPTVLLSGDSIAWGNNNTSVLADARNNISGELMGLDSSTNGRMPVWNVAMFSANMNTSKSTTLNWVKSSTNLLGNVPFTHWLDENGINDLGVGSLAGFQTLVSQFSTAVKTNFPGVKYYKVTMGPETISSANCFFVLESCQSWSAAFFGPDPSIRSQANAWLLTNPATVDGVLDIAPVTEGADTAKWPAAVATGLLTSAITAGTSPSFTADTLFPVGTSPVFEANDATNSDGANYQIWQVTGSGPWTYTVKNLTSNSNKNIVKDHAIGTSVSVVLAIDGLHPNGRAHNLRATKYITEKVKINYLLNRDINPANDNSPTWLERTA